MSIKTSFSELVSSMVSAYEYLNNYIGNKSTGIIYLDDTIRFLTQLKSTGNLSTKINSEKEIARFFRVFLDIVGIISATKGQWEPVRIGDIKLIGKKRDVSGILSSGQTSIDDWICSILFQGWIRMHEPDLWISEDLRYRISKYGKNCDFEVVGNGISRTLVECKRLHPFYDKEFEDNVPSLIEKILDKCSAAKKQFDDTENSLGNGHHIRALIVDIASYGENCSRNIRDGRMIGLDEKTEIVDLLAQLAEVQIQGVHLLVLAWNDVFFFEGAPRALVYYTNPLVIDDMNKAKPKLSYAGWTVEFYPRGKELHKYLEFRLSKTARSRGWIHASWLSTTDNLVTFGPTETKPNNNTGER